MSFSSCLPGEIAIESRDSVVKPRIDVAKLLAI